MNRVLHCWMDGWMDGRMDGWMNDEWIDDILSIKCCAPLNFSSCKFFRKPEVGPQFVCHLTGSALTFPESHSVKDLLFLGRRFTRNDNNNNNNNNIKFTTTTIIIIIISMIIIIITTIITLTIILITIIIITTIIIRRITCY